MQLAKSKQRARWMKIRINAQRPFEQFSKKDLWKKEDVRKILANDTVIISYNPINSNYFTYSNGNYRPSTETELIRLNKFIHGLPY